MTPLFLLLLALPLFSQPIATSITPSSGPTSGGTEVTIKGNFGTWPYGVIFGNTAVPATRVDENTLVAVTPQHLAGVVEITIFEYDIGIPTDLTFEFFGTTPETFERLLLPVFTPPVNGAFGAVFHTALTITNHDSSNYALVEGIAPCDILPCPTPEPHPQLEVHANRTIEPDKMVYNGNPGRFIYATADHLARLAMNLRVHDVTREDLNFGTEIPIVRTSEFVNNRIVFTGVPTDPRFRNTLRIYGDQPFNAWVSIDDQEAVLVRVDGATDLYSPTYGVFSAFPTDGMPVRVTIDADPDFETLLPVDVPFWAMITVTNNDTQVISTITPQP